MGSVYRDRDRYDDSRTSVSSSRRDGPNYTVKRYIVKEDDSRSNVGRRSVVPERVGERVEETRIIRRDREEPEPLREVRREQPRYSEEELIIRRERDDDRRDPYYDRRPEPVADRELVIRRTEREDPRVEDARSVVRYDDRRGGDLRVTETRYRDDYDIVSPSRDLDDRELQRYSRTAEYFTSPQQPQTIVIRQEPIIIRERYRDDDYQIVRKSDIEEERSVVRREPRAEEDFFYEKKVRERIDDPRDEHDRRRRRSVSPHDSVSQRGRDYSSDDSMVYVKKETRDESGSESPHRKRNLAAGVLAGVAANELLRNHKKKEGRETSHGVGRIGRDIGAGALGAIAAEGISRARSVHRSRSRRRDRDRSRSRSRRRSRSRSNSPSKLTKLGAVGLGAAALAAAAAIAQKKMGSKEEKNPRRSRSRHRRDESLSSLENDSTADNARNPRHRKIRMAEAGAAGAAVAGLIERARSKSRARDGKERSQSRVRQALPVVAAGLGSAALAGLYEKNKAKKEAEAIQKEERRARSRSRSRARSDYYDGPPAATMSDPGLIEYGNGPMYGNNYGPGYYGRTPEPGYYSNAVVPAAVAGGAAAYATQRGPRSRSRSVSRERGSRNLAPEQGARRSSRSSSSSAGGRRRRRSRSTEKAAAAALAGAAVGSEYERHKAEKRERKARKHRDDYGGGDPYEDSYNANPYGATPPPPNVDPYGQAHDPYASSTGFYPQTSQFPPPPGSGPQQYATQPATAGMAPGYAQQQYPPPPPPGPPPANATNADAFAYGANPFAPRGPDNVSAAPPPVFRDPFPSDQHHVDGVRDMGMAREPPPTINVEPPSTTLSAANPVPDSGAPPPPPPPAPPFPPLVDDLGPSPDRPASTPRSHSQPPSARKSVQFSGKDEVSTFSNEPAAARAERMEREQEEQDTERRRRRHRHSNSRGYEAGDDTDSTPDELRRSNRERERARDDVNTLEPERGDDADRRKHHRRRRSHDPSSSRSYESSSRGKEPVERVTSPANSEATIDLPDRFDEKGRKKPETGDDPLADRVDELLHGKGAAGKVFGNFLDGLFGPEGKKKRGR